MERIELTIGGIVEELISVKDGLRGSLTDTQMDAIDDACNILDHVFPRMATKYDVVDDAVCRLVLTRERARELLPASDGRDRMLDRVCGSERERLRVENACVAAFRDAMAERA